MINELDKKVIDSFLKGKESQGYMFDTDGLILKFNERDLARLSMTEDGIPSLQQLWYSNDSDSHKAMSYVQAMFSKKFKNKLEAVENLINSVIEGKEPEELVAELLQ